MEDKLAMEESCIVEILVQVAMGLRHMHRMNITHRDIKAALGADSLGITDIFRFPTLEGLAAHLDKRAGGAVAPQPAVQEDAAPKAEVMSKRRAMRAGRTKADT